MLSRSLIASQSIAILICIFGPLLVRAEDDYYYNFTSDETNYYGEDVVFERPFQERYNVSRTATKSHRLFPQPDVLQNVKGHRQAQVWNMIDQIDSFKTNDRIYSSSNGNRPTAKSFHYLVLPTWWNTQNSTNTALEMDVNKINRIMAQTAVYYSDMSFGKMDLTYEVLDQTSIIATKKMFAAKAGVLFHITNTLGLKRNVHYDGIIYLFWSLPSTLNWSGAAGVVNGNFIWSSYNSASYKILRHEIGHNFGHDHHSRYNYVYRDTRPDIVTDNVYKSDGFDMMSGGNSFAISDFHLSSKWFFNWVEDSSVVKMQPEGQTAECPTCLKSGSFTIKPFDMRASPSQDALFGVHIPITTLYDQNYNSDYIYSYWLSYRSGVDGGAEGLSIHLTMFELYNSTFGTYYDSLYYYAEGYSDSKFDSVVKHGNCYHISPTAYLKDRDLLAVEAVQPVVCVDEINRGLNIKISVSFDNSLEPSKQNANILTKTIECGSTLTQSLDSSVHNLIHIQGTGLNGKVTVKLCTTGVSSWAFLFDDYPYSAIKYNSKPSYGSMKRLWAPSSCNMNKMATLQYDADYDNTYILIPSKSDATQTNVEVSCSISKCARNQYKLDFRCIQCPDEKPRSNPSSTGIHKCFSCPPGTALPHPLADVCTLSDSFFPITRSTGWRIWAPIYHTLSENRWSVKELKFYPTSDCSGQNYNPVGEAVDSGNFDTSPQVLFDESSSWSGKSDSDGAIWVGMTFSVEKFVQCVKVVNSSFSVSEIRVQALRGNEWLNVWVEKDFSSSSNVDIVMIFDHPPTPFPTTSPTAEPTTSPTKEPTSLSTPTALFPPTTTVPTSASVQNTPSPTASVTVAAPTSSNCSEEASDKFFRTMDDNLPITKTCNWLQKQNTSLLLRMCAKTKSYGSYKPASEVCKTTCNTCGNGPTVIEVPVQSPVKSPVKVSPVPTNSCVEIPKNKWVWRFNGNTPVAKTCTWLGKVNKNSRQKLCERPTLDESFEAAAIACPVTCGTCGDGYINAPSISPDSSCQDSDSHKFFFDSRTNANGDVTILSRGCVWLRSKSDTRIAFYCERSGDFGLHGAKDICLQTCDNC